MKTPLIAFFAAAALSIPALAQDQKEQGSKQSEAQSPSGEMQRSAKANREQSKDQKEQGSQQSDAQSQSQTANQGQTELSSSEVKSIQQELKSKGLHAGPVDGIIGPETKAALEQFQKQNGIKATGEADEKTLAALGINREQGSKQSEAQSPSGEMQRSAKANREQSKDQKEQQQNQPEK